jgi:polyhydroxybutyrate depolymerase
MKRLIAVVLAACGAPTAEHPDAHGGVDASGVADDAPAASATCTGKPAQPQDTTWNVTVGSATRMARVHVPASYDRGAATPVVINIHGRTSTAQQQASLSRAIAKSDAEGFIVIHPESATSPTSWNAGGGCCDPASATNVDDAGFIRALIDEAEARLCVDPDRVYVMGLSNGGFLAHRVACELGDRIAAIGPVAGLLSLPTCAPKRAMPVLLVHGTADAIVSYDWVDETIDYWRIYNRCTTQTTTYQNGDATCVTHGGCTAGADVVLCTISGGGHQWPGGEALPFLGPMSDDLIATDAIWSFFVAHPRG